jgi:hypothetical protein
MNRLLLGGNRCCVVSEEHGKELVDGVRARMISMSLRYSQQRQRRAVPGMMKRGRVCKRRYGIHFLNRSFGGLRKKKN